MEKEYNIVDDATLQLEIASYAGEKSIHARDVHALLCELKDRRAKDKDENHD